MDSSGSRLGTLLSITRIGLRSRIDVDGRSIGWSAIRACRVAGCMEGNGLYDRTSRPRVKKRAWLNGG